MSTGILARMNWTQFVALLEAYGPLMGLLIALILLIVGLRKAWPTITLFVTTINTVASLPGKLAAIDTTLSTLTTGQDAIKEDVGHIKHEVQTNGGGSLKDAVKNTEKGIKSLQGSMRNMSGRVTKIEQGQKLAAEVATERSTTAA